MLLLGTLAQVGAAFLVASPVFMIPSLLKSEGLSLAAAGAFGLAPTLGMVFTLFMWGVAADRFGERAVISVGLGLASALAMLSSFASGTLALGVMLFFMGAASAATDSASGRVVVGWFTRERRGLAMGIRQTAFPAGIATAALVVPPIAAQWGAGGVMLVAGLLTASITLLCALGIRDPARTTAHPAATSATKQPNPYRAAGFLLRIHAVAVLLVIPQVTLSTFGFVWLSLGVGLSASWAGAVVATAQLSGAFGRILVGSVSDRVGSRVRVIRWVSMCSLAGMLCIAGLGVLQWPIAAALAYVLATVVSVADNGLNAIAVAEAAGSGWTGRVFGVHNTLLFATSFGVGPGVGALIAAIGYPLTFAALAATPLAARLLLPQQDKVPQTRA